MQNPANLRIANVGLSSPAAPGTNGGGPLIPAPGPGQRIRLWAAFIDTNSTSQAPGNWWADVVDAIPPTISYLRTAKAGFDSAALYIPGGYALPTNQGAFTLVQSSGISISFGYTVYYTIEAVN